jgi:dihydroorotate dehydrogenase (fumarate)
MDLSTTYLGLRLPHPFMPGASPLVDDLDAVRRLEDAGAAAIVMHSLFEEQITGERQATLDTLEAGAESFGEALTYFPAPPVFPLGPDEYLEHLRRVKEAVRIPVIGSLNGHTPGGWIEFASRMEQAGADALELNIYLLATDPSESSSALEARTLDLLRAVKRAVRIPVAAKLSPYYSTLAHFAGQLDALGVDGLVLFNRFYQPDLDVEELEVVRALRLSDSSELPLRLRWLAVLSGRVKGSLAVTGGVHTALDAIKAVMVGAHAVQMVSALLKLGPGHLTRVRREAERWLEEHEYRSLAQAQGSMNLVRCPDPQAYERANYLQVLQSWRRTPA